MSSQDNKIEQDKNIEETAPSRKPRKHCNQLDGKQWIQNSISVWSDIRKNLDESRLKHPAMFPLELAERLIKTFLPLDGQLICDPFSGSGTTVLAAEAMEKKGIGFELSEEYAQLGLSRLQTFKDELGKNFGSDIIQASAMELLEHVSKESVDLSISSPPYWDILNQRRSADRKNIRNYGNYDGDIGTIVEYDEFLDQLQKIYEQLFIALKPGCFACIIVMDIRKKSQFYPFHSDLANRLIETGFIYDDLIIWNRQSEYNNLRPLGYPSVFRMNKVHEYILLMQKPR